MESEIRARSCSQRCPRLPRPTLCRAARTTHSRRRRTVANPFSSATCGASKRHRYFVLNRPYLALLEDVAAQQEDDRAHGGDQE